MVNICTCWCYFKYCLGIESSTVVFQFNTFTFSKIFDLSNVLVFPKWNDRLNDAWFKQDFQLKQKFALPDTMLKSKNYCIANGNWSMNFKDDVSYSKSPLEYFLNELSETLKLKEHCSETLTWGLARRWRWSLFLPVPFFILKHVLLNYWLRSTFLCTAVRGRFSSRRKSVLAAF